MHEDKFKKGDKVRIIRGSRRNETATVTDGHWRDSVFVWPEVEVLTGDRKTLRYSEDELELLSTEDEDTDEYEYSMAIWEENSERWNVVGDLFDRYNRHPLWRPEEVTRKMMEYYRTGLPNTQFKLVKRRKAGETEDVSE